MHRLLSTIQKPIHFPDKFTDHGTKGFHKSQAVWEFFEIPAGGMAHAKVNHPILPGIWEELIFCGINRGLNLAFIAGSKDATFYTGQVLDIHFTIPTSDGTVYRGQIRNIELLPNNFMRLHLSPVQVSMALANDLAAWLVFMACVSPAKVKRFGFPIRIFHGRIKLCYASSTQDYTNVLELRRQAYTGAGKIKSSATREEMAIELDKSSHILCAYHGERLVASAAIFYPESESVTLRSETAFPGNKFPNRHLPKREVMEINCLCTDEEYRGGDLFLVLYEHLLQQMILSKRKWVLAVSDLKLKPMYLKLGFHDQQAKGVFHGQEHHLIKFSKKIALVADNILFKTWASIYYLPINDLREKNQLKLSPIDKVHLLLKLQLAKIVRRQETKIRELAFQSGFRVANRRLHNEPY